MSSVTISAIKADIGGYVGHGAVHRDLHSAAEARSGRRRRRALGRRPEVAARIASRRESLEPVSVLAAGR